MVDHCWRWDYHLSLSDLMMRDDVNKKYVRKQTVTITRTEEFSLVDEKLSEKQGYSQLAKVVFQLVKKYIYPYIGRGNDK